MLASFSFILIYPKHPVLINSKTIFFRKFLRQRFHTIQNSVTETECLNGPTEGPVRSESRGTLHDIQQLGLWICETEYVARSALPLTATDAKRHC